MKNKPKQKIKRERNFIKSLVLLFFGIVVGAITISVWKSNNAYRKAEIAEEKTDSLDVKNTEKTDSIISLSVQKAVDSIDVKEVIERKLDDRYRSYDNSFLMQNGVVINENDTIIGYLAIYTNKKELVKFYKDKEKTTFYYNIMNKRLKVITKK